MNFSSCLLILLALSGCAFAKSTFRDGLDIVRKQNPSDCANSDALQCANEIAQIDQSQIAALLAVICRPDCISSTIQQQVCLGEDEKNVTADFQLYCAKNNGEFCQLLFIDGQISGDIPQVSSCSFISEDCTSDCRNELTSTSSFLGCCTTTYAETNFLMPTFEKCEVTLDDPCPAVSTDQDSADEDSGASYATPMFISMIIIGFIATIM